MLTINVLKEQIEIWSSQLRLIARAETDESAAAQFIHSDLLRMRAEVTALETRAQATRNELRQQVAKDAASLAINRDPEKGMTRLEYFRDVGQGAPSAALQTFVSAAVRGDDEKLASMVTFSGEARGKLESILAALPDEARQKYPSPEKLSVLYFGMIIPEFPSAEFSSVAFQDAQHAVVSVRGFSEKTDQIQMQLNGQAWQVVVPSGVAERLGSLVQGGAQPKVKK